MLYKLTHKVITMRRNSTHSSVVEDNQEIQFYGSNPIIFQHFQHEVWHVIKVSGIYIFWYTDKLVSVILEFCVNAIPLAPDAQLHPTQCQYQHDVSISG